MRTSWVGQRTSFAPPWAGPHSAAMPEAMQAKGLAWLEPAGITPLIHVLIGADVQH